jgi:hypothetical protein
MTKNIASTFGGPQASARQFAEENPKGFFVVTEKNGCKTTFFVERGQAGEAVEYWNSLPFSRRKIFTANI